MVARGIINADTEAKFRHAVELDPNFVVAQVHLARVLRKLNRSPEAEPIYRTAVEQAKDAPTLVLIAEAMQSEGNWSDSGPVLRRALTMDPRNPGALFLLGRFLSASGKYADAEPVLKQAIEVSPKLFAARSILRSNRRAPLGLRDQHSRHVLGARPGFRPHADGQPGPGRRSRRQYDHR
jgi:Tfp pilus assembly protein PilF